MRSVTAPIRAAILPQSFLAVRSDRGNWLAYLRALTLTIWFGSIVYNYWWRQEWGWMLEFHQEGINLKDQYAIGFAIALVAHLTLGPQKWFSAPFRLTSPASGKLLTVFCVLMFVLAPFSASVRTSAVYSLGTWLVFLLCYLYWSSDYDVVRRVLVLSGILLLGWLFVLLIHHGFGRGIGSSIGNINRNTTSTVALAAMICCMFSRSKLIRWGGVGAALLLAVLVTSRGSILALGVFVSVYYALNQGTAKAAWHAFLALFLAAMVLLGSAVIQQYVFEDVLRLNDPTRGIGSGLTGRIEAWKEAIEVFWKSPLIGHGFRVSGGGGQLGKIHSGYLKIFAETGVFGGTLILAAVACEMFRRWKTARQFQGPRSVDVPGIDRDETIRINTIVFGTLCTTLVLWIYEPLYINLGSVISILFFLMMAAPLYVADKNVGIPRRMPAITR